MDNTLQFNKPWILQRADPYVTYKDGWYYFTASIPAYDAIVLRRSRTLTGLAGAEEKVLWTKHKKGPSLSPTQFQPPVPQSHPAISTIFHNRLPPLSSLC